MFRLMLKQPLGAVTSPCCTGKLQLKDVLQETNTVFRQGMLEKV